MYKAVLANLEAKFFKQAKICSWKQILYKIHSGKFTTDGGVLDGGVLTIAFMLATKFISE